MAEPAEARAVTHRLVEQFAMAALTTASCMLILSQGRYFSVEEGLLGAPVGAWASRRLFSGGRRYYASLIALGSALGLLLGWSIRPANWGCGILRLTGDCVAWLIAWTLAGSFLGTLWRRSGLETPDEKALGHVAAIVVLALLVYVFVLHPALVRY